MPLRIYNTLSGKKEEFVPGEEGKVSMYVCGPTVYDSSHIGHARSVVVFDVVVRYLKASGYDVNYIRNFTDIDDKIINRANELGVEYQEVSEKYIAEFHRDMGALNVLEATHEPRATEHIGDIISVIELLIDKGMAYPVDGDVYYCVDKFSDYGKLSGRKLEDMEAGARIDIDERKRSPFDFALWKSVKPGEPSWESPWGDGRPGWHIECSAMSSVFLGKTFDIHGGGKDLIFPHHENEIAQSEGAFDKQFVKYWIHNGFVNINQEKMSKSLGNSLFIKDVIKLYSPETIRIFLLSNHYRSPIDFTDQSMEEATIGLEKVYALLDRINQSFGTEKTDSIDEELWGLFCEAMDDDFNTAKAIGIIFDALKKANRMMDENTDQDDTKAKMIAVRETILRIGNSLGIFLIDPAEYFESKKATALDSSGVDPEMIENLLTERAEARKSKNFARADEIRAQLDDMNISIEDKADGTIWKINS
jgi:cysteinyl-tRNA synthetase